MKRTLTTVLLLLPFLIHSQVDLSYQLPHDNILELADANLPPSIRMNSKADKALLLYRKSYKSIQELSEPEMRLAGLRINPVTNISSRQRYYYDISLFDPATGIERVVDQLPEHGRFSNFSWSPDETMMAFTNTTSDGVELWVVNVEAGTLSKLTDDNLNGNMGRPFYWMRDNNQLLVKTLPENRKDLIDKSRTIPSGPTVSTNDGKKAQNRTYQDLLKDKTDEFNFEQLALAELWMVDLQGQKTKWMDSDIYSGISLSPDGNYFLVTTVNKPYSYLVPYRRFPLSTDIYDREGNHIKTLLDLPLIEDLPKGFMSVRTGPRNFRWRADKAATLYWCEALDGGDANIDAEYRDEVYELDAPFDGDAQYLLQTKNRFSGITWGNDNLAIAYDYWWNSRNTKSYIFNPDAIKQTPVIISDRNYQDRYSDPGDFVTRKNSFGRYVLDIQGDYLYLLGDGFSDEGIRPFVDRFNLMDHQTERLYQADGKTTLESINDAIDLEAGKFLVRIQSPQDFPNYFIRDINTGSLNQLTHFKNPFSAIQDVHKEVIKYKRDDGLELSATLYLPQDYDKNSGKKLPMLMWAYPREFKDKSSASQVTSSPNEFTYPWYGSPLFWLTRGYAVLDDAAFPIVGEGDEEPNDSFRSQLVANAKAAIDAVDEMGYIDRNRVGVGGHSYGAFMTANLLSHSNLFAAGIARSGAYNRTLTPFGFQSEERSYWEAPEVYYTMSPFMHAEKMKTPLLLIHGEADNNSGTYPMQSERYFNALKGLGATVRLVMLPKESHGYVGRESVLHVLWEQDQWLEKYVKNRKVQTP